MPYKCIEAVTEFHVANHQAINQPSHPGLALLRIGLIAEELSETLAALRSQKTNEVADGLADLLYVTYGTAVSYGVPVSDWPLEPDSAFTGIVSASQAAQFAAAVMRPFETATAVMAGQFRPALLTSVLGNLCGIIADFAAGWGWPMDELFFDVHASNMTKTFARPEPGQKYGAVNPKGPGYRPPATATIMAAAEERSKRLTGVVHSTE
jgi:predicted HAD superfamily Cof-like phosphohydrolase